MLGYGAGVVTIWLADKSLLTLSMAGVYLESRYWERGLVCFWFCQRAGCAPEMGAGVSGLIFQHVSVIILTMESLQN